MPDLPRVSTACQVIFSPATTNRADQVNIRIQLLRSKRNDAAFRFKRGGLRLDHVQIADRTAPIT